MLEEVALSSTAKWQVAYSNLESQNADQADVIDGGVTLIFSEYVNCNRTIYN